MGTPLKLLLLLLTLNILSRDVEGKPLDMGGTKMDALTQTLIGLDNEKSEALSAILELLDAIDLPSLCHSLSSTSPNLTHMEDVIARAAIVYDKMQSGKKDQPFKLLPEQQPRLAEFTSSTKEDFADRKMDLTNRKSDFPDIRENFPNPKQDVMEEKADFRKKKSPYGDDKHLPKKRLVSAELYNSLDSFLPLSREHQDYSRPPLPHNYPEDLPPFNPAAAANNNNPSNSKNNDNKDNSNPSINNNNPSTNNNNDNNDNDNPSKTNNNPSTNNNNNNNPSNNNNNNNDKNSPSNNNNNNDNNKPFRNNNNPSTNNNENPSKNNNPSNNDNDNDNKKDDTYDASNNFINNVAAGKPDFPPFSDDLRLMSAGSLDNTPLLFPEDLKMLASLRPEDMDKLNEIFLSESKSLKPDLDMLMESLNLELYDDGDKLPFLEEYGDMMFREDGKDTWMETTPSSPPRNVRVEDSAAPSMVSSPSSEYLPVSSEVEASSQTNVLNVTTELTPSSTLPARNMSTASRNTSATSSTPAQVSTAGNSTMENNSHEESSHSTTNTARNQTDITGVTGDMNNTDVETGAVLFLFSTLNLETKNTTPAELGGHESSELTSAPSDSINHTEEQQQTAGNTTDGRSFLFNTTVLEFGAEPSLSGIEPTVNDERSQPSDMSVTTEILSAAAAINAHIHVNGTPSSVNISVDSSVTFHPLTKQEVEADQEVVEVNSTGLNGTANTDSAAAAASATPMNTSEPRANTSASPVSETEGVSLLNTTTVLLAANNTASLNFLVINLDEKNASDSTDVPILEEQTQKEKGLEEESDSEVYTTSAVNNTIVTLNATTSMANRNASDISLTPTTAKVDVSSQHHQDASTSSEDRKAEASSQTTTQASTVTATTAVTTEENTATSASTEPSSGKLLSTSITRAESNMELIKPTQKPVNSVASSEMSGRQEREENTTTGQSVNNTTDTNTVTIVSSLSFDPELPVTKPASEQSSGTTLQESDTALQTERSQTADFKTAVTEGQVREITESTSGTLPPETYYHIERQEWKPLLNSLEKKKWTPVKEFGSAADGQGFDQHAADQEEASSRWADRHRLNQYPRAINSVAAATPADDSFLQKWFQPMPVYGMDAAASDHQQNYLNPRDAWRKQAEDLKTEAFSARLPFDSLGLGEADRLMSHREIRSQAYSAFAQGFPRRRVSPFRPFLPRPNLGTLWANGVDNARPNQHHAFYNFQPRVSTASPSSPYHNTDPLPSSSYPHPGPDSQTTPVSQPGSQNQPGGGGSDDTYDVKNDSFKTKEEELNTVINKAERGSWKEASPGDSLKAKEEALTRLRQKIGDRWSGTDMYGRLQPKYEGYACPGLFGFFGDMMDCHSFFICSWGVPYRFACPSGTLWNPTRSVCDWSRDVTCSK